MEPQSASLYEYEPFRNRYQVFADRTDAGRFLAALLAPSYAHSPEAFVLAIPSGGVPVGIELASGLGLPLDLIIVRKLRIPGNTEAGFGAVGLGGGVFLNDDLVHLIGISQQEIASEVETVRRELEARNRLLRGDRPFPDLYGKTVLLSDDGLASGFTAMAAANALLGKGAGKIVLATPTAPRSSINRVAPMVDEIYCANVHDELPFAVANAYRRWYDLTLEETRGLLEEHGVSA
jgi:putative phosphoribosyl transferase